MNVTKKGLDKVCIEQCAQQEVEMNIKSTDVKLGGKLYSVGHPLNIFRTCLYKALGASYSLPRKWGDYNPYSIAQELLMACIASLEDRNPRRNEMPILELTKFIQSQIDSIDSGLEDLKYPLVPTPTTASIYHLYAELIYTKTICVAARNQIEYEDPKTSTNVLSILDTMCEALEAAAQWVHSFLHVFSCEETGKLIRETYWIQWDEEKYKRLN